MNHDRARNPVVKIKQKIEDDYRLSSLLVEVDELSVLYFLGTAAQVVNVREQLLRSLAALPPTFVADADGSSDYQRPQVFDQDAEEDKFCRAVER
jgi:hypothetical protein